MSEYDVYEGTDQEFARRVQLMVAASGGRITVVSAFRTVQKQKDLWDQAVLQYGSEQAARKYVAPPGRSNHNKGLAIDLDYVNDEAEQWAHDNAGRFGLLFPMSHEPWHIEPVGVRDGTYDSDHKHDPEAYTTPPDGIPPVADTPRTLQDYALSMYDIFMSPSRLGILAGPDDSILNTPAGLQEGQSVLATPANLGAPGQGLETPPIQRREISDAITS